MAAPESQGKDVTLLLPGVPHGRLQGAGLRHSTKALAEQWGPARGALLMEGGVTKQ